MRSVCVSSEHFFHLLVCFSDVLPADVEVYVIASAVGGLSDEQDDNDWVKRCMTWEVEGIRQRGRLKETLWECVKNDSKSLGLSPKDAQFGNKWRRRIKEATRLTRFTWKNGR